MGKPSTDVQKCGTYSLRSQNQKKPQKTLGAVLKNKNPLQILKEHNVIQASPSPMKEMALKDDVKDVQMRTDKLAASTEPLVHPGDDTPPPPPVSSEPPSVNPMPIMEPELSSGPGPLLGRHRLPVRVIHDSLCSSVWFRRRVVEPVPDPMEVLSPAAARLYFQVMAVVEMMEKMEETEV